MKFLVAIGGMLLVLVLGTQIVSNSNAFKNKNNATENLAAKLSVTPSVTPQNCPAAPSIANNYLQSLNVKSGGKDNKNIVSLVAKTMGPQTEFKGVDSCDATYSATVKSYVDVLLKTPVLKK